MENKAVCSAVIVAAGKGKRMGTTVSKQYLQLNGIEIIVHTLQKFQACNGIQEIIVVSGKEDIPFLMELVKKYGLSKVAKVIAGGKERQDSVLEGVKATSLQTDIVAVHDGVRPFVRCEDIEKTIDTAREMGACVLGVPAKDTIKRCNQEKMILDTPDRSMLWYIQTPQTFRKKLLLEALQTASQDVFLGTDDAMLVERLGKPVKVIEGQYDNIKITTPEDLDIAGIFLRRQEERE